MGERAKDQARKAGGAKRGRLNIGMIDLDTGVLLDGVPVLVPRKDRLEDWAMMMLAKLGQVAQDRDLTGETLRVLLFVLSRVEWENWVRVSQTDLADALGMQRTNVSRAMRMLVGKGILEKAATTIGGSHVYRVSKEVAWRGKVSSYRAAKRGEKPPAPQPKLRVVAGKDVAAVTSKDD